MPFDEVRRLVWLNNWADAARLLDQMRSTGQVASDENTTTFARAVYIRGNIESIPLPEAATEIDRLLELKSARTDAELRIQLLAIKADIEFQYDLAASEKNWVEARTASIAAKLPVWTSRADGELGTIDFLNGQIFRAVRRVSKALLNAEFNGDVASQIRYRTALGEGLSEFGRKADALRFFDKALDLAKATPGAYFPFTAYLGKARLLATDGSPEDGIQLLRRGLGEARAQGQKVREARILVLLGELAVGAQNYESANADLIEAANVASAAGLDRIEADATRALASLLLGRGDNHSAVVYARRSVAATNRATDKYHLPESLAILGDSEARVGNLRAAEAAFTQASDLVDTLLRDFPHPRHKNTLVATMGRVFQGHVDLALRRLKDPRKAFQILESAKARGLTDVLQSGGRRDQHFPWDKQPANEAAKLQRELAREDDSRQRIRLLDRLWELEVRSFRLGEEDYGRSPQPEHVSLENLQAVLSSDEAVIEFLVGEERSFVLLIGQRVVDYRQLPSRRDLDTAVEAHLAAISAGGDAREQARKLYGLILQPLREMGKFRRLVIVPDGSLHRVPFGALVGDDGRYVIESQIVSYAPSATVYELLSGRKPRGRRTGLLAVGGVNYRRTAIHRPESRRRGLTLFDPSEAPRWPAIPQSFSEATDIAAGHGSLATVLTADDATEWNVKHLDLSTFGVLHLALHSTLDREFPDRSALVFTFHPGESDDGLLQAREILGMRLNAELVTLSACDGGAGPIEGIAGVNSLVEAFLMAGSRSVVATIWDADDVFTGALMRRFYNNLESGVDKAEALARAKRELLQRHGPDALPIYWAGFRIVGDAHGTITGEQR